MDNLQEAYLSVYQEVNEAMAPGTNKDKMIALANHPRTTTQDRGNIHNIAVRNDTGPSYTKKSTGGKGSRFPGYGDQGAGNKASRRAGNEPMRGNRDPRQQAEEFDLFDYLLEYLVAEGYANTNENAIAIMANMSEEWRAEILDEANRGEAYFNTPNWDKTYDRTARDYGKNHTSTQRDITKSGKQETTNQTTKRLSKERVQAHKDTRGMKKRRGSKGVWFSSGRM